MKSDSGGQPRAGTKSGIYPDHKTWQWLLISASCIRAPNSVCDSRPRTRSVSLAALTHLTAASTPDLELSPQAQPCVDPPCPAIRREDHQGALQPWALLVGFLLGSLHRPDICLWPHAFRPVRVSPVHHYKATVIKTLWYWWRVKHVGQWNSIENPEINPHRDVQLIFDNGVKAIHWNKYSLCNQRCYGNATITGKYNLPKISHHK